MLTALVLTGWAVICIYDFLGPKLLYAARPLIAGTVAGLIVGDLPLGMGLGATMELAALGAYTYGGACIPDYTVGSIVGTALAHASPGGPSQQLAIGLALGMPTALLLTALDPIARFLPAFWLRRAEHAALAGRPRQVTMLHWTAFTPWAAVRAVPTFTAVYFLNGTAITAVEKHIPAWFTHGMALVGSILPAAGFAMLLTLLPVRRYWYMLLIGYVLFAYLKVPPLGIALFGLPIAIMFVTLQPASRVGNGAPHTAPAPSSAGSPTGEN